jgi:hypothetical protein
MLSKGRGTEGLLGRRTYWVCISTLVNRVLFVSFALCIIDPNSQVLLVPRVQKSINMLLKSHWSCMFILAYSVRLGP